MTETATVTIAEWLLVQVAADEAAARHIHAENCETPADDTLDSWGRPMSPTCACDYHIARVLAECQSKRQVIAELVHSMESDYAPWNASILRALALPYADRPGYEEWL